MALRKAQQPLKEFALINSLVRRFPTRARGLVRGIGDDAAVVVPPANRQLVLTTDLLAEGIHFDLRTASFEDIGYKAAIANLSDIAAMGARPEHVLVALAIPASEASQRRQVVDQALEALAEFDTPDSGVQAAVRNRMGKLRIASVQMPCSRRRL